MKILSQRDRQWSTKKIGDTKLSIGRWGCLITSISMLSSYFKPYNSPEWFAENCKFTKDGLLYWSSCKFANFRFVNRVYHRSDRFIKQSLKHPNTAVVLELDYSHWVVAIGRSWLGGYRIADPFYGNKSTTRRYGRITGSAHFTSV